MVEKITLETAYRAHLLCKAALITEARQNPAQTATDIVARHRCELGKWLSDDGEKLYGTFAEFRRVIAKHEYYYSVVAIVANIADRKGVANFHGELISSPPFARASMEVGIAINELKAAVDRVKKSAS